MMLFAYLEVIYKTLHMELLKTWHQQFVEDHGTTQQKLNFSWFLPAPRAALLARAEASLSMKGTPESSYELQSCPRAKHPIMDCLSLLSFHFGMSSQLQLVLAVGNSLLETLRSTGRTVLGVGQPGEEYSVIELQNSLSEKGP